MMRCSNSIILRTEDRLFNLINFRLLARAKLLARQLAWYLAEDSQQLGILRPLGFAVAKSPRIDKWLVDGLYWYIEPSGARVRGGNCFVIGSSLA